MGELLRLLLAFLKSRKPVLDAWNTEISVSCREDDTHCGVCVRRPIFKSTKPKYTKKPNTFCQIDKYFLPTYIISSDPHSPMRHTSCQHTHVLPTDMFCHKTHSANTLSANRHTFCHETHFANRHTFCHLTHCSAIAGRSTKPQSVRSFRPFRTTLQR